MKVALAALLAAAAFLIGALRIGGLTSVPLPPAATVGARPTTVLPTTPSTTLMGNSLGAHAQAGPTSDVHAQTGPGSVGVHAGPSPRSETATTRSTGTSWPAPRSTGTSWPAPSLPPSTHFTTGSLPPVDKVRHEVQKYDAGDRGSKGDQGDKGHGGGR